ncbi:glycosyltransferase family 2 protein [Cytobacillus gottheilii]|uniref:Glycosyltransferase n=1 Tax=Cytobacillus gottheilii TaxID=859144 RepID=A0ABX8FB18_9BACI|nr:glycosyltransferase [Cytobacillus gottheilii]QVY61290.1 glycosyltransferase [Cytobacillus gottheilii]
MREKIKISVIIPVYNAELYLEKCVNSVTTQTHRNLEIILINDGSTDNSGLICNQLASQDERINVVHTENRGQASARNKGIDLATGDYIGFVDSDDYISHDMYETMLEKSLTENADIVQIGHYVVSPNGEKINTEKRGETEYISYKDSIRANVIEKLIVSSICDKLFRSSLWTNIRMADGYYYEDGMVLLNLLRISKRVLLIENVGYYYVLSTNSTQRGPYTIKHLKSCLYEPKYYYEFFKNYYKELTDYGIALYCFRAMRGYRFAQSIANLDENKKEDYEAQFKEKFITNYLLLKKTHFFKGLSIYQKTALYIFSKSPKIYLSLFSAIKK